MSKYTLSHSTPYSNKDEQSVFTPHTPSAPLTPIEPAQQQNLPDNYFYSNQSPSWTKGYNVPAIRRPTTAQLREAGVLPMPPPVFDMPGSEPSTNWSILTPQISSSEETIKSGASTHHIPSHSGSKSSAAWLNRPSHAPDSEEVVRSGVPAPSNYEPDPFLSKPNVPLQPSNQADPFVTNMALQYGTYIVGSSKEIVDKEIGKYVALSRLKYYFAVDTAYVLQKLMLLLFPFRHQDWSLKYSQNEPLQPRHDVNAPDLYIPIMAYVTYVLVAGLVLGTQNRFSPEILGILASQALAWTLVEVVIQLVTLYVTNIQYNMRTLDIIAFAGYKFVGIILSILMSLAFGTRGYILTVFYTSASLIFFMVRTLKFQMLVEKDPGNFDNGYDSPTKHVYSPGNKRKMYFMVSVALFQPILMWWLSSHLIIAGM